MRKISANYIFPVSSPPIRNGILVLGKQNEIIDIIDPKNNFQEIANLEFYNGVLVPGFVNVHCQLELSHLKNEIFENSGIPNLRVSAQDLYGHFSKEEVIESAKQANDELKKEGVVAVGDISTSDITFEIKQESIISYYTFVELFEVDASKAKRTLQAGRKLLNQLHSMGLHGSLTPHSFYSVPEVLLDILKHEAEIYSIHFMKSRYEKAAIKNKMGSMTQHGEIHELTSDDLLHNYTLNTDALIHHLPNNKNVLLVHSASTDQSAINMLTQKFEEHLFWVTCPRSNLFIEDKLADLAYFHATNQQVTIGTDSLASNQSLSVLEEMKAIKNHFPEIPFEQVLSWTTLNGAKAIAMDKKLGSFEIGKQPGINIIENFDFDHSCLRNLSKVRVICS